MTFNATKSSSESCEEENATKNSSNLYHEKSGKITERESNKTPSSNINLQSEKGTTISKKMLEQSKESQEENLPVAEENSEFKESSDDEDEEKKLIKTLDDIDISETEGSRRGTCKWYNVIKGWGFIKPNDGGHDVFVHQSVILMSGFRSLGEHEEVEFECKLTEKGLEATKVSAPGGVECRGSSFRPHPKRRFRRVRCYNCGKFANHIAAKCSLGPQPKQCHFCKSQDHLLVDCPVKKDTPSSSKI